MIFLIKRICKEINVVVNQIPFHLLLFLFYGRKISKLQFLLVFRNALFIVNNILKPFIFCFLSY
jgi:hypothetical protein